MAWSELKYGVAREMPIWATSLPTSQELGGLRLAINSAALRFIPRANGRKATATAILYGLILTFVLVNLFKSA